jgi:hypothetical protein
VDGERKMTTAEQISLGVALGGLAIATVALVFNGLQTRRSAKLLQLNIFQAQKTAEHLLLDQQLARGNAVVCFTGRFFDLLKEGKGKELSEDIQDPNWAYQFWSLHATEFFFFQHGMLPTFMYILWMIDLGELYSGSGGQAVYQSHSNYLQTYSVNYHEMTKFFESIHNLATISDQKSRNTEIWNYVDGWIKQPGHRQLLEQ